MAGVTFAPGQKARLADGDIVTIVSADTDGYIFRRADGSTWLTGVTGVKPLATKAPAGAKARPAPARVYNGPFAALINSSARANALDPFLLAGLFAHESGFRTDAVSATGDVGVAQINLASHPDVTDAQARDPAFAIPWAARYLARLKASAGGSTVGALRAYNTGSAAPSATGNAYADAVLNQRTSLLQRLLAAVGYVAPVPGAKVIRLDQGIDYQGAVGGPVVAIGNGVVDAVKSDPGGFGRVVYYTLTDGPRKGQQVYVGHAAPTVAPGERLTVGQRVATLLRSPLGNATQPGWTEVGFAQGGAPVSHSEADTGSATQFASFLHDLPLPPEVQIGKGVADAVTGGNPVSGLTNPFKPFLAIGAAADKFVNDPSYPFLWLGFMLLGLALIFVGVERILGRSAGADARRAATAGATAGTVVAAPEAAPVLVGA